MPSNKRCGIQTRDWAFICGDPRFSQHCMLQVVISPARLSPHEAITS